MSVDQREHEQIFPRPGWVEHDAAEIWHNVAVGHSATRSTGPGSPGPTWPPSASPTSARRRCCGTERPVSRCTTRSSGRTPGPTGSSANSPATPAPDRFRDRCGTPLATYFSGPKIRWLLDRDPELRRRAEDGDVLFGTIDTWLIWQLTGGPQRRRACHRRNQRQPHHADEPVHTGLGRRAAGRVRRAARDAARRSSPAPTCTARPAAPLAGVPVASALGDQQAALFGQACFAPGEAKCTYGTGSFLLLNTGTDAGAERARPDHHGRRTRWATPPRCTRWKGSIAVTGALVQWLRDNLGLIAFGRRDQHAGGDRTGQRRLLHRARVRRAVRAVLADRRARHHRRPDRAS